MKTRLLVCVVWCCFLVAVQAETPPEEEKSGAVVFRLVAQVADRASAPGLAEMTYTLTVEGGPLLEVESVSLVDALEAWQASPTCFVKLDGERLKLTEVLRLQQIKPGEQTPPALKVRFRDSATVDWSDVTLANPLKPREDGPPEVPPPFSGVPVWLLWAAGGGVGVVVLLTVVLAWRGLKPAAPPKPTLEQALLVELARLEQQTGADRSEWYHTRLSYLVRRYLAEKYQLPATQQTTADLLAAVKQVPQLAGEEHLLRQLLERCDLAKFAPVSGSVEECSQATELARTLLEKLTQGKKGLTSA